MGNHKKFLDNFPYIANNSYFRRLPNIIITLAYILLSTYICIVFIINANVNGNHEQPFQDMLDGTAFKPYVYRVLVPVLLRCIDFVSPQFIENAIILQLRKCCPSFINHYHISDDLAYLGLWSIAISLLSLFIYCRLLYLGGHHIVGLSRAQAAITPLLGLFMLPPFFREGYIYDLPQLTLFSACLYLMFRQQWKLYFIVFVLLCLNKETGIIILFAYLANYVNKHTSQRLLIVSLLHLLIYGTIRLLLEYMFQDNSGVSMQIHIVDQAKVFLERLTLGSFSLMIAVFFIITYGWVSKPIFLRRSVILAAPLLALFLVGGSPGEYRVFYEVVYVVTLLIFHSIVAAWQNRM